MKKLSPAGVILALLVVCAPAHATEWQLPDNPWYLSPMYDHVSDRDGRDSHDGNGGSIYVGKFLDRHFAAELGYFQHSFSEDFAGGPRWNEQGAELSGMYFYNRAWAVQPYFTVGAGYDHTKRRDIDASGNNFMWDVGLGAVVPFHVFGYPLGLRADVRERFLKVGSDLIAGPINNTDGRFNEPIWRVGIGIPFGAKRVAPLPDPCLQDSDGDGVPDCRDRCPGTPKGTPVGKDGCEIVAEETPKLEDVYFHFDKSDLTEPAKRTLDKDVKLIGDKVKKNAKTKVEVSGHTDWIGSDAYNQALSERRALTVKNYLLLRGIEGSRITTQAFGESKPIGDNKTDEGRAMNRRAEIRTR